MRSALAFQLGLQSLQFEPCLTLPLLIFRFLLVDDTKNALTTDYLVTRTDFFYARTNFHERLKTPVITVNLCDGT